MSLHRNRQDGYLAAVVGSVTGAVLLRTLGMYLAVGYLKKFMPNAELEGIFPLFIGHCVGWWVGEVLGCWLCLRWRHYRRAGATAALLAKLAPVGIIFWQFFYVVFSSWIRGNISALELEQVYAIEPIIIVPITISLMVIPLALLARFLTKPLSPSLSMSR